jgi:hypothetical protein
MTGEVTGADLIGEYARMAADEVREAEALEWANALLPDAFDESDEEDKA